MTLRSRVTALVAAALVATSLAAVWVPPADAAGGTAPVTAADAVTVTVGVPQTVDVLTNDSDADGDKLAVCRLGDLPDGVIAQTLGEEGGQCAFAAGREGPRQPKPGQLLVLAVGEPGTYTVTYYACDFSYLTAGTLTITVVKPPQIRMRVTKVEGRPGTLKLVNRSGLPVQFSWGSYRAEGADGTVTVGRKSVTITVRRRSIVWIAFSRRTSDVAFGLTRDIRLPRGADALPPGAPRGPLEDPFKPHAASPRSPAWLTAG